MMYNEQLAKWAELQISPMPLEREVSHFKATGDGAKVTQSPFSSLSMSGSHLGYRQIAYTPHIADDNWSGIRVLNKH